MTDAEWEPALYCWTIYNKGTDGNYKEYTARMWVVEGGGAQSTGSVIHSVDIDYMRGMFNRMGLAPFARSKDDDLNIIETWL